MACYFGTYGWTLNSGQLIGIISAAAFSFIVQLPREIMDLVRLRSLDWRFWRYLIIWVYEWIELKTECLRYSVVLLTYEWSYFGYNVTSLKQEWFFLVNFARTSPIYWISDRVVVSSREIAIEVSHLTRTLILLSWKSCHNCEELNS